MKRHLLRSPTFVRATTRLFKKQPQVAENLRMTLQFLAEDAFHPSLKTHKLKGDLTGSWSCSVGYDLRIVFTFVRHEGQDAILLESIGTHEEVY